MLCLAVVLAAAVLSILTYRKRVTFARLSRKDEAGVKAELGDTLVDSRRVPDGEQDAFWLGYTDFLGNHPEVVFEHDIVVQVRDGPGGS